MRQGNFSLRLAPSLFEEARQVAKNEGIAMNQFITVAIAEKLSALRTALYFQKRGSRASLPKALKLLKRAGKGVAPAAGDELPNRA